MQSILQALKLIASEVSHLSARNVTAIAGVAAPIIAAVAGAHITAVELGGYLTLLTGVCAFVSKLGAVKAKPAPAPAPVKK